MNEEIDKLLVGYFNKEEEEQDEILTIIAGTYITYHIGKGRNYKQILKSLDADIYTAKVTENFEKVAAFNKIKEKFIDIINESLNNQTNV